MSVGTKLLQAAAGNAGEAVYVDDLFSTQLYTGDGTARSIVNGVDLSDKGGLVWTKNRGFPSPYNISNHNFVDSTRGVSKYIRSNATDAEATDSSGITAFNNNGYSLGTAGNWNASGSDYVSWTFAKQEKFFDIVTYTGNATAGRTISHNLGSVPGMIIIKSTSSAQSWAMYHRGTDASTPEGYFLILNNTDVRQIATSAEGGNTWNNTAPTATEFTLGDYVGVNKNGDTFVAYLFAHDESEFGEDSDEAIIKCGRYNGNGSSGQFINLGFEPQFLMIKSLTSSHDWYMADNMRGMANTDASTAHRYLYAQAASAEEGYASRWRRESTGFHLTSAATGLNGSSNSYMYVAIARSHKPASEFAATNLFTPLANPNNSSAPYWTASHVIDTFWQKNTTSGGWYVGDRLRQGKELQLDSTAAEGGASNHQFDYQTGVGDGASGSNAFRYLFRRAKGFFDVVSYTGDGTSTSFSHNLGATPELKIIKIRSDAFGWLVGGSAVTGGTKDYQLYLDTNAAQANTNYWGAVDSASAFSVVASNYLSNVSGQTYLAYLFATVAGISKIGSYTGTGSDLNVDCGFSAGARFVVIKRTDSTGDWYVFDSVRGIVAGNDPYYLINSNAAQVTNTDYIDPLSSGFTITSSAPAGLNASSGTYIFLAIA